MIPPARVIKIASRRNWLRMSLCVAPIALRIPISRVRSVTETSIIFIIPIPPTRSEIEAMARKTELNMLVIVPTRRTRDVVEFSKRGFDIAHNGWYYLNRFGMKNNAVIVFCAENIVLYGGVGDSKKFICVENENISYRREYSYYFKKSVIYFDIFSDRIRRAKEFFPDICTYHDHRRAVIHLWF